MYRYISFDFWNTLASPNKRFAIERNKILQRFSNKPAKEVESEVKHFKGVIDKASEEEHYADSSIKLTTALYNVIRGEHFNHVSTIDALDLYRQIQNLAINLPPIIDERLLIELDRWKRMGLGIGITSNTNFIAGSTLRYILNTTYDIHFDTYIFSDEVRVSKPSPKIFDAFFEQSGCTKQEIVHIGDNLVCDGAAEKVGFSYILTKNPANTIKIVKQLNEQA